MICTGITEALAGGPKEVAWVKAPPPRLPVSISIAVNPPSGALGQSGKVGANGRGFEDASARRNRNALLSAGPGLSSSWPLNVTSKLMVVPVGAIEYTWDVPVPCG